MTENNRIEIPLSKAKLTKFLVLSIIFTIAGLWMIISNPQTSNPVFNNTIIKIVAAYGATVMGGLGIYFYTKKLFDKKPGLILSAEGVYENTTAFKFGLIPWTDISGIYERSVQASIASKQHFVTVALFNSDKYISRTSNFLKRKLLEANTKSYGSPIHISANGLKINHKDLLKLAKEYFDKYKQPV